MINFFIYRDDEQPAEAAAAAATAEENYLWKKFKSTVEISFPFYLK